MAVKFLDLTGLQKFWTKCKNAFVAKNSNGGVSITGTLTVNDTTSLKKDVTVEGNVTADKFIGNVETESFALKNGSNSAYLGVGGDAKVRLTIGSNTLVFDTSGTVATTDYVTAAVANAGHLKREIVDSLPGVSTAKENVIYMVSNNTNGNNQYDEYMLINGAFEKTGSSDVDLSGYSTTEQMNTAISNAHTAITEAEINALT